MDVRGHGESAKLYDPAHYRRRLMAADAANLLDHLGIGARRRHGLFDGRADRGRAGARPSRRRCARWSSAAWASALVEGIGGEEEIARALEADGREAVAERRRPRLPQVRRADRSDLQALAACMRGQREPIAAGRLAAIRVPVLVAVGSEDEVAGSAAGARRADPGRRGARYPRARPHARHRRQGVQGGRARFPEAAPLTRLAIRGSGDRP